MPKNEKEKITLHVVYNRPEFIQPHMPVRPIQLTSSSGAQSTGKIAETGRFDLQQKRNPPGSIVCGIQSFICDERPILVLFSGNLITGILYAIVDKSDLLCLHTFFPLMLILGINEFSTKFFLFHIVPSEKPPYL
jgi:hypothetical protein